MKTMETLGIGFRVFGLTAWFFNLSMLCFGLKTALEERRPIRSIFIFLGILVTAAIIVFLSAAIYPEIWGCK